MSKLFSMSILCLGLANITTALVGKNYAPPRPITRQLFTPQIPGIPADLQPTQQRAAQVRTPENVARLQRDFIAQAPAAPAPFNHNNPDPDPNSPMNGRTNYFTDDMFSEDELLSSSDEEGQEPRAITNAQQQNRPDYAQRDQQQTSRRRFIGEARARHFESQVRQNLHLRLTDQQLRAFEQRILRGAQQRNAHRNNRSLNN